MINSRQPKWQNDIREYEAAHIIADLANEAHTVLNVGPSWGRDYYMLARCGKYVVNLDIAPQHHLPNMLIGDASTSFPFSTGSFDIVLLPEVLEHLVEDWVALREAFRVLKDDGGLIVTVPFFSDAASYHIRIHSPKSILRLLAVAGFSAERVIYRGGWIRIPRVVHAIRRGLMLFGLNHAWYRFVLKMDRRWGQGSWAHYAANGVYILARKGEMLDWRRLNREGFQH
ncbi:MAG: class I SAM-dependent methyltransferase [Anaerolineae bacterium]